MYVQFKSCIYGVVTADIEKTFDSVNIFFIVIFVLKKYDFSVFENWVKVLPKNQKSFVINIGFTARYFKPGKVQGKEIKYQLVYSFLFSKSFFCQKTRNIKRSVYVI